MDGNGKKPLKTVITNFYKLHMNKGKEYTFKNFKKFSVHKATIYRWLKKIEQKVHQRRIKMDYKAFRKFGMNLILCL